MKFIFLIVPAAVNRRGNELHVTIVYKVDANVYKAVKTILSVALLLHFHSCVYANLLSRKTYYYFFSIE